MRFPRLRCAWAFVGVAVLGAVPLSVAVVLTEDGLAGYVLLGVAVDQVDGAGLAMLPILLRPFRFMTSMPPLASIAEWRNHVRRVEDLGFDTIAVSDHVTGGWSMDPIVAMTVAAENTTRLRVASVQLCNDFRHPVIVHKAMANLDVFSAGRVEIGLGAGWLAADHESMGLAFDEPAVRLDRLEESLAVMTALFTHEYVDFIGKHYTISALPGVPKSVQQPHPPIIVGGGSRRILQLAGRTADIAGINPRLAHGVRPGTAITDMSPTRVAQKVAWVHAGAVAAGRDSDAIELQMNVLSVRVITRSGEHTWISSLAAEATAEQRDAAVASVSGTVDECVDQLHQLRERHGISYLHLGNNLEAAAPLVEALAGR